jgi:hypothetical protein
MLVKPTFVVCCLFVYRLKHKIKHNKHIEENIFNVISMQLLNLSWIMAEDMSKYFEMLNGSTSNQKCKFLCWFVYRIHRNLMLWK